MQLRLNEYTSLSRFAAIILFVGILPTFSFYLGTEYEETKAALLAEEPDSLAVLAAAQGARVGWKLYEDLPRSFSIGYPPELSPQKTFQKHHALGTSWRVGKEGGGQGVLSIPLFRAEEGGNPSRFYSSELRIGVSDEEEEAVLECLLSDTGKVGIDAHIGDTIFRTFPIEVRNSLGYVSGTSYRTVHEGRCYAIEELESGDLKGGDRIVPDKSLHGAFTRAHSLTETFRFMQRGDGTGGI